MRRFAPLLAALGLIASVVHAQPPAKTASSAAPSLPLANLVDLEDKPPTNLGTKLDPNADWSKEARPLILRPRLAARMKDASRLVSASGCDFRVKDDWLKMTCKGRAGRVVQVAGDTKETVAYISHQHTRDPKDRWKVLQDERRLIFYTRLVPGEVSVFQMTAIGEGYSSDYEGHAAMLTVDWADPDRGPRLLVHPIVKGFW